MGYEGEFVKHLRLLHFTLASICLVLLAAVGITQPYAVENAYKQAVEIRSLAKEFYNWMSNNEFTDLASQTTEAYKNNPFYFSDGNLTYSIYKRPIVVNYSDLKSSSPLSYRVYSELVELDFSEPENPNLPIGLGNLYNFKVLWNHLYDQGRTLTIVKLNVNTIKFTLDKNAPERIIIKKGTPPTGTIDLGDDKIYLINIDREWRLAFDFKNKKTKHPFTSISIPVKVKKSGINYQKKAIDEIGANWFPGVFNDTFTDLSVAVKNKESLTLRQLENQLQREASEEGQNIQLFGASIPLALLRIWGPILLIILQAYFLSHIRYFSDHILNYEEVLKTPWVCLYDDIGSKAIVFVSIAMLPFLAGLVIVTGNSDEFISVPSGLFAWASLIILGLVGITTWKIVYGYNTRLNLAIRNKAANK